jgi:MOSC domain-containing protein YiiM
VELTSINVGRARELRGRSFDGTTGIFKEPVDAVAIGELGLDDDAVCDTKHHGGPDQAVYLYRAEDHDWWAAELGGEIDPGIFGENLTIRGLPSPGLAIGARLTVGAVELEITAPRIPCNTLAERMGDARFGKHFVAAERPGFYARVITPGTVHVGDAVTLEDVPGRATTVDLFRDSHRRLDPDEVRAWLALPIDARTREKLSAQLQRA